MNASNSNTTDNTLEDWFVNIRTLSITVIGAVLTISAKASWYYFTAFLIGITEVRAAIAVFFGCVTGAVVSMASFHKAKFLNPWIFYGANIILTALIFEMFDSADLKSEEFVFKPITYYIEYGFLSFFIPTIELAAVTRWKKLRKKVRKLATQTLAEVNQLITRSEQQLNELKQSITKQEQTINELEQSINKIEERKAKLLEEERKRTCLKCGEVFGSVQALNPHKCKVEDIKVISEEVKAE